MRDGAPAGCRAVLGRRGPYWLLVRLEPPSTRRARRGWRSSARRSPACSKRSRARRRGERSARRRRAAALRGRAARVRSGGVAASRARRGARGGKPVAAYGESMHHAEYWVASGADQLWMPETGSIHLVGLRSEAIYFARPARATRREARRRARRHAQDGWRDLHARVDVAREREQIEAYLDDVFGELVDAIATGRRLDAAVVRERIDAGPYRAATACEAGLVDDCLYPDQVEEALANMLPASGEAPRSAGRRARASIDAEPTPRSTPTTRAGRRCFARDPGSRTSSRAARSIAAPAWRASRSKRFRARCARSARTTVCARSCCASRVPAATRSPPTSCGARRASRSATSRWWCRWARWRRRVATTPRWQATRSSRRRPR